MPASSAHPAIFDGYRNAHTIIGACTNWRSIVSLPQWNTRWLGAQRDRLQKVVGPDRPMGKRAEYKRDNGQRWPITATADRLAQDFPTVIGTANVEVYAETRGVFLLRAVHAGTDMPQPCR